jgi:hypothetical protein
VKSLARELGGHLEVKTSTGNACLTAFMTSSADKLCSLSVTSGGPWPLVGAAPARGPPRHRCAGGRLDRSRGARRASQIAPSVHTGKAVDLWLPPQWR